MPEKSAMDKAFALLDELEQCEGPCGSLCLHCPEAYALDHIKKVINELISELDHWGSEATYWQTKYEKVTHADA